MSSIITRSKTGLPGITAHLQPNRIPRYSARLSGRHLGSFTTLVAAQTARVQAQSLLAQGKPLPSGPRWREQVGTTGIKTGSVAGHAMYRYEVNVTQPDGKTVPFRSQWFETMGEALVARQQALDLVNEGKQIIRAGKNWTEVRYPIEWVTVILTPAPDPAITVEEWAIRYYREIVLPARISEKWKNRYRSHLMTYIVRVLGPYHVHELTPETLLQLEHYLEKQGHSESIKTIRTTLWRMIEAAIANGIQVRNPVTRRAARRRKP